MHAYDRDPHLLSLRLSLDVFGRILAIFLIGLTLLSLTYLMEFAVLSQSHKLSASWLAQPNHFFPVFASVSLKSMSSWDRGLSWLLSHLGNHDIYRLSRQAWVRRLRMAEEALSNPWGGGWFNLSRGNSNQTQKWKMVWGDGRKIFQTIFHLIFHWNVQRTHVPFPPPIPSGVVPAVPVCRDHNGFLFSLS